jgi:hypothetical protein
MTALFEARPRFVFRRVAAASADAVVTISRSIRRTALTALDGTQHVEAPRVFAERSESPSSGLWILHAR